MKRAVFIAVVLALVAAGSAYAADHIGNSQREARVFPRWQRISNCFVKNNWIVSVDTPSGGYAYNRGSGVHFQQWVAWWVVGHRVGRLTVSTADSGLLTSAQVATAKTCVGFVPDH